MLLCGQLDNLPVSFMGKAKRSLLLFIKPQRGGIFSSSLFKQTKPKPAEQLSASLGESLG